MQRYTRVNSQFGSRVRQLREKRGWLIDRLAGESSVSGRTVLRIENIKTNETRNFHTANLNRIATALNTTLEHLLEGNPLKHIEPAYSFKELQDHPGELLRDERTKAIYWTQGKIFHVPNFDIIFHMKAHKMPGWERWRDLPWVSGIKGPLFYHKDAESNGILIKLYKEPFVFLIDHAQKRQISDVYTFENYRYAESFLEWGDIISVTEEIVTNEFPTGTPIKLVQNLHSPENRRTLRDSTVALKCTTHPNPSWNYHFQIATTHNFENPIEDSIVSVPELIACSLTSGTYFWRVRGVKHGRIPGAWSKSWSFIVSY